MLVIISCNILADLNIWPHIACGKFAVRRHSFQTQIIMGLEVNEICNPLSMHEVSRLELMPLLFVSGTPPKSLGIYLRLVA
jgi:hypothetical protein